MMVMLALLMLKSAVMLLLAVAFAIDIFRVSLGSAILSSTT